MQQFPVPQNLLEIEYKLFGAFTVRQFIYLLFGFGTAAALFVTSVKNPTALPFFISLPISVMFAGLGAFLGLAKINGVSGDIYLKNFLIAISRPTRRVWQSKYFKARIDNIIQQREAYKQEMSSKGHAVGVSSTVKSNNVTADEENKRLQELSKVSARLENSQRKSSISQTVAEQNGGDLVDHSGNSSARVLTFVVNTPQYATDSIVMVKDSQGKIISTTSADEQGVVKTASLSPGVYEVSVFNKNFPGIKTFKVDTTKIMADTFKVNLLDDGRKN